MSNSIADRHVLVLNSAWQAIRTKPMEKALGDVCNTNNWYILQIEDNGNFLNPLTWDAWIELPTDGFEYIGTANRRIRMPTVVITRNYSKVRKVRPRLNKNSVYDRDQGRCCYTNRHLSRSEATLDHVHAESKGGKTSWENIVLCAPEVNHAKGNKTVEEAGLKLLRNPKEPMPMPSASLMYVRHEDWEIFLP